MNREEEIRQESVVEAVLFTMGRSVDIKQLAIALDTDITQAKEAAERLRNRYLEENRAMQIIVLEDSYQMCTKAEYYDELIKVAKNPKKQVLTEVVLETLSIIAYKQPVTKGEIEKIRGVSSAYAVNKLVEYGLVQEVGRLEAPGRPVLFGTTEEFLRRFGIDSKNSLPETTPDQEAEIIHEVQTEVDYKFGTEPSKLSSSPVAPESVVDEGVASVAKTYDTTDAMQEADAIVEAVATTAE